MDLIQGLLTITPIYLVAIASPGPDLILVTHQTLSNGKKAGLICSIGVVLGLSIHITYTALGLALIIANSPAVLWAIKLFGGCFLILIGFSALTAKPSIYLEKDVVSKQKYSYFKSFGIGFLGNLLNPLAPLFFLSLFTIVLSAEIPLHHLAVYGAWMIVLELIRFSLAITLLSVPMINRRYQRYGYWIDRILGIMLIAFGLVVIASGTN
jgi:threonine/homoserine/homoserine lactone efflux protein